MKSCAIICEYNPFHNGHKYLIDRARENGFDTVVAIMSGNLTQRGELALCGKAARAKAALFGGADLVVELPSVFAMASASYFATAGVYLAAALGCDGLVFGSESGKINKLTIVAERLESKELEAAVCEKMKSGIGYAAARQAVYTERFGKDEALSSPNDILGIEYLRAIKRLGANLTPICFKRVGASHDGDSTAGEFASASFLREQIRLGKLESITPFIPNETAVILENCIKLGKISDVKRLDAAVLSHLRSMTAADFSALPDIEQGLDFRLYHAVGKAQNLDEVFALAGTKRYTAARIRRIVLAGYFGIFADRRPALPTYLRILGMTGQGEAHLKEHGPYPVPIALRATALREDEVFQLESHITDLFVLSFDKPDMRGSEWTTPIIKL